MRKFFFCVWVLMAGRSLLGQVGMYEAGGHKLYLNCVGERHGTTVIMEAGAGRSSEDWSKVQPEVAKFTQACSYDRLGYGKSEGAGEHDPGQSVEDVVDTLRLLLKVAKIAPPYVMVGHSAGGLMVRRFAIRDPAEVKGMVLVDSVHEEQLWRFYAIDPAMLGPGAMTPENQKRLGAQERLVWHTDIPLIVLRHGLPFQMQGPGSEHAAEVEAAMQAMQKDLASRSSRGELRVAEKSNHFIQLDQPELVIAAIRDVWVQAKTMDGR